jgi:hypothetical protein
MPTFALLTGQQRGAIAHAAFSLLEEMGVRLTEPDAQCLVCVRKIPYDTDA